MGEIVVGFANGVFPRQPFTHSESGGGGGVGWMVGGVRGVVVVAVCKRVLNLLHNLLHPRHHHTPLHRLHQRPTLRITRQRPRRTQQLRLPQPLRRQPYPQFVLPFRQYPTQPRQDRLPRGPIRRRRPAPPRHIRRKHRKRAHLRLVRTLPVPDGPDQYLGGRCNVVVGTGGARGEIDVSEWEGDGWGWCGWRSGC